MDGNTDVVGVYRPFRLYCYEQWIFITSKVGKSGPLKITHESHFLTGIKKGIPLIEHLYKK